MSFRSDPIPSYEDVISGNFLKKSTASVTLSGDLNEKFIKENEDSQPQNCRDFKYKKVNKIRVEDVEEGEIPEEGEFEEGEILDTKRNSAIQRNIKANNRNNTNNTKDIKKNTRNKNITDSLNGKRPSSSSNNTFKLNENQKKNRNDTNFTSNLTGNQQQKSSSKTNNNTFVPRLICRYFMEGLCTKADKCTFSHSAIPNKTPEEARVKEPCKFLIAGSCMKGDSCYFSHDLSVVPCKFFHLKGECSAATRGTGCRFSHAPIDEETFEKLKTSDAERSKEKAENAIVNTINNANITTNTNNYALTNHEQTDQSESKEEATNSPHYTEMLLNPFACDDGDDDNY